MIKHIIIDSNVDTELLSLEFEIKFSNLIKLNEDRVNSINQGLDGPVEVKAFHQNKIYDARVRLKGDLKDHWLSRYRYSLRVKLSGHTILGMKTFRYKTSKTTPMSRRSSRRSRILEALHLTINMHE